MASFFGLFQNVLQTMLQAWPNYFRVDADDIITLHIPKSVKKKVILWKDGRRIAFDI